MTVTIDLDPGIERELLAQARERGVTLNALVQDIVSRQVSASSVGEGKTLKLPALHLGPMSSLHRCDIYDDVG
jgi:hypothetical protein